MVASEEITLVLSGTYDSPLKRKKSSYISDFGQDSPGKMLVIIGLIADSIWRVGFISSVGLII